jgi:hypothetical protein
MDIMFIPNLDLCAVGTSEGWMESGFNQIKFDWAITTVTGQANPIRPSHLMSFASSHWVLPADYNIAVALEHQVG